MKEERYINPFTDFGFKNSLEKSFDDGRKEEAYKIAKNLKKLGVEI